MSGRSHTGMHFKRIYLVVGLLINALSPVNLIEQNQAFCFLGFAI
jgi:hypothetical protein